MASIKEESEDVTIDEAFRVKQEDTEEQADLKALNGLLNKIKEEEQYLNRVFKTEEKSYSCSETKTVSIQEMAPKTENISCFTCQECGKSFTYKVSLNRHMRIHTGEKPYSCQQCEKSFTNKGGLNRHMRIHTGERPYTCRQCGKGFHQHGNLKVHMRIHTGEKRFACQQCGKRFQRKLNLGYHMTVHTGERPYTCQQCGKSFTRKGSLDFHMRLYHSEKNTSQSYQESH